ncbi:MAG: DUF4159 domain-containing protein, partial [Proteobacteria bacterium]|nr:DUF4159 domain-containing protein [Pseudomonadota bacterium]
MIDNGWSTAADWPRRMQAAQSILDRAQRAGREAALLTTAPGQNNAPPAATPPMPVPDLRARLATLRPEPWPSDREAATRALEAWDRPDTAVAYLADGLTDGPGYPAFAARLARTGSVTELCCDGPLPLLLQPPRAEADGLALRAVRPAGPEEQTATVLAQSGDGRTLARAAIPIAAGAAAGEARLVLPPEVRNRLARLVVEGPPSAAGVVLLDERWRRRPVGLVAGDQITAEAPLTGALFYLRRALAPYAELREGALGALLSRDISVLILADRPLPAGPEQKALTDWVEKGGLLIRFAGPRTAEMPVGESDPLLPVKLLGGDRQLGGALSWSQPAALAPFPPDSPFAGLRVPDEVKVTRQVLAEPSAQLSSQTWAALADGTPLVTQAAKGAGRVVLFHVTANADWSNLPLSGLFVDMLRRLVDLSVGVTGAPGSAVLAPAESLDGFGVLGRPPDAAVGIAADRIGATPPSPRHPPGLYGPESGRMALNLGAALPMPEAAPAVDGARVEGYAAIAPERALGPPLMALAVALLAADLLISLMLRGFIRRRAARLAAAALLIALPFHAQALETGTHPALAVRLGYIVTGDAQVDTISRTGLEGLSDYVNRRTAATLVEPDPIVPGETDLSFYPLIYWPITATAQPLTSAQAQALNDYMSRGGIILIDTRGGSEGSSGSGAGFAPGTEAALRRAAQGLAIPALAPLTTEHVLARSFYLLQDFPGRFTGSEVWVQRDQDRANDSVSPVIIGSNDWAAAWAVDESGRNPYATIPGGARQRTLAYRFGVNLVMYALTGNYKG